MALWISLSRVTFKNVIYRICENGAIHYTTICSNSWIHLWIQVKNVCKIFRNIYGQNNRPWESIINRIIGRFQRNGLRENQNAEKYGRKTLSEENIELVRMSIFGEPRISITRRSLQHVGLSKITILHIL